MVRLTPITHEYDHYSQADLLARDKTVAAIKHDVDTWNQLQHKNPDNIPRLLSADFSDADLQEVILRNADLRGAKFRNANLSLANFEGADLRGADFTGAYGYHTIFREANMLETKCIDSGFPETDFRNASLLDANFSRSNLQGAKFSGAFVHGAKFESSNLNQCKNFSPDSTLIRQARFSVSSTDLWSQLRRHYTGPRYVLNLLLVALFLAPLIARAFFWAGVTEAQGFSAQLTTDFAPDVVSSLAQCLADACQERAVWYVVLGLDRSPFLWATGLALLTYNLLKAGLTMVVAPMRDEEERTGYSPRRWPVHKSPYHKVDALTSDGRPARVIEYLRRLRESYGWMQWPHRFVRLLLLVSVLAFAVNAMDWMSMMVWLPA